MDLTDAAKDKTNAYQRVDNGLHRGEHSPDQHHGGNQGAGGDVALPDQPDAGGQGADSGNDRQAVGKRLYE